VASVDREVCRSTRCRRDHAEPTPGRSARVRRHRRESATGKDDAVDVAACDAGEVDGMLLRARELCGQTNEAAATSTYACERSSRAGVAPGHCQLIGALPGSTAARQVLGFEVVAVGAARIISAPCVFPRMVERTRTSDASRP
jgi:hypothetical protein